ncbi:MAG TPA: DUF4157 domain-containing protein [Candidatus Angelobacter sp.]|nr:DUF4157 domain-containing protein [Candidatus Angelobacter sp.]
MQRRASGNATGPAIAPPIVHEVLRSPGQPLDKQTRAFFEPRFGHDFSRVRVHTDSRAAESAAAVNALAYTVGDDISFAGGRYAPDKPAGRELLAHELAHVIQRSSGEAASSEAGLEEEASRAARAVTSSTSYKITFAASPGSVLFVRQTIAGKDFEIGDVVLNSKAATDVKTNGVLFPGPDQAHIAVTGDRKLGYEVAYAAPDDPFRWGHLKDIVDKGSLDIAAVAPTDTFKVKEVAAGKENVVNKSLAEIALTAGAITLPRLSVQKAIDPNAKVYIASADDSRDQIFYDSSGQGGRGMLGSNSLAHELFGHLWLSRQGASWKHNTQIDAASGVKDPMGRSYTGGVNEYISHYAGESGSALQSPSQGVGPSLQADILSWFGTNGASGLTRSGNTFKISSQFGMQWERLSGNYSVLKFKHENETQPASTMANVVTTADGLRKWVVNWFNALTPDQQWVFKNFLSALTVGWSAPQGRRTELALDLKSMLP